jgi:hypothetical protein
MWMNDAAGGDVVTSRWDASEIHFFNTLLFFVIFFCRIFFTATDRQHATQKKQRERGLFKNQ